MINWLTCRILPAVAATILVVLFTDFQKGEHSFPHQTRRLSMFDPRSVMEKNKPHPAHSFGGALEFVHIPMNGGGVIEKAAWDQKKIKWGVCHFSSFANIGCDQPDWPQKFDFMGPKESRRKYTGGPWHAPPIWLHPNPYMAKDTFCIIRNPYDRVVAEYHQSTYSSHSKDPREMNEWIQLKMTEIMKMSSYPSNFLPQHFFVFNHHRKRVITHVLRYEHLEEDFSKLMRHYNLDITLPPKKKTDREIFTKEFLSPDTISVINDLYGGDFRAFGYPMVTRPSQFAKLGEKPRFVPDKLSLEAVLKEELPPNHSIQDHINAIAEQKAAMAGMQQVNEGLQSQAASGKAIQIQKEVQLTQNDGHQQQPQPPEQGQLISA